MVTCKSHQVKWFQDSLSTESISEENELIFYEVTLQDLGDYYCYGAYEDNRNYFIATVKLKVYGKSIIA